MQAIGTAPSIPGITAGTGDAAQLSDLERALAPDSSDGSAKTDDDIARAMEKIAQDWFEAHQWFYVEATEATANYFGAQWGYWSHPEMRYITMPAERNEGGVRLTINILRPAVDQAVGIMTQEEPVFDVIAGSTEGKDLAARQSASDFTEFAWVQHVEAADLYRLTARDIVVQGTPLVHVCWDVNEGPAVANDPVLSAEGVGETKAGDIRITRLTPDMVAYDPSARSHTDGSGVFIKERWSRDEVMRRYPEKFSEIAPNRIHTDGEMYRTRAENATRNPKWAGTGNDSARDEVDVYWFYGRSTRERPRGILLVFCDGVMLEKGDNPKLATASDAFWPKLQWPVFAEVCDPRGNSPWGAGRVYGCIDSQRALNGVASKTVQHVATISNVKAMLPKGLDVEFTDEIGQTIRVPRTVGAGQIGYLQPPSMPPEFLAAWAKLQDTLEYYLGVNASTMGSSASNVESGRQANILIERDYGRLRPVKRRLDRMWCDIMRYFLQLFREYGDVKRKVLIAGENHTTSIRYFDKSDFTTEVDLKVRNDQSIPRDPSQRAVWLSNFMQTYSQAQADPKTQAMLLRLYGLKDFEGFLERLDPHKVKAQRAVDKLMLGEAVPITPFDDALSNVEAMERLVMSEEYENRVAAEKAQGGFSPLESAAMMRLTYFKEQAAFAMGIGAGGAPMAPPMGPTGGATTPQEPTPAPEGTIPRDEPAMA